MAKKIEVKGSEITVISKNGQDYMSLTDMLKAKDGDFLSRIGCEIGISLNI